MNKKEEEENDDGKRKQGDCLVYLRCILRKLMGGDGWCGHALQTTMVAMASGSRVKV